MTIGETIRHLRKQRNLTQEQLAEVMGVSTPAISKWETGQSAPELSAVLLLADFFGVSVDCLVGHQVRRSGLNDMLSELEELKRCQQFPAAIDLAERILHSYPNHYEAVDACANAYYAVFIQTQDRSAIERSLELVQRLFPLREQNPRISEYELYWSLANHYELMGDYVRAKDYYEKSNLCGIKNRDIARCLLRLGRDQEGLVLMSKEMLSDAYRTFSDVTHLMEIYQTTAQPEKGRAAVEWGIRVLEGLPRDKALFTSKLLTFLYMDLFLLHKEQGLEDAAAAALSCAVDHARYWDDWSEEREGPLLFLDNRDLPQLMESTSGGMNFVRAILSAGGYEEIPT